jgi:hypothetical protein
MHFQRNETSILASIKLYILLIRTLWGSDEANKLILNGSQGLPVLNVKLWLFRRGGIWVNFTYPENYAIRNERFNSVRWHWAP